MTVSHLSPRDGESSGAGSRHVAVDMSAAQDTAWIVLEAANDLGDHATVEACRRVIDAHLNGIAALQNDVELVQSYFR
jgi:hypothetical protein